MEPAKDIVAMINHDHAKMKAMYEEYKGPGMNHELKQKLTWALIREIAMHSSAEEEVMYPEVRTRLGDEAADQLLAEHQQLKELLSDLNAMNIDKVGEATFDEKVKQAVQVLKHHIHEEEDKFWPQFKRQPGVDADLLGTLGAKFEKAKGHAVTRPHPWAPNKPPLNVVANMMTAPLDAAADQWRFAGHPPE